MALGLRALFGDDFTPIQILVVGLGKTGLSIAHFLYQHQISFNIVDSRNNPPLLAEFRQQFPNVEVLTGGFDKKNFIKATHLIVSPGISLQETVIQQSLASNTVLLSDIDLFSCMTDADIVAITGSNGKSTVTTLLGEMATESAKKVAIGGNLGTPALDLLNENIELYILELSSFQLERSHYLQATVATVLNISADHLDRHQTLSQYALEKYKVFQGNGVMLLNADDERVMAMHQQNRKSLTFSLKNTNTDYYLQKSEDISSLMCHQQAVLPVTALALTGTHNIANALACLALGDVIGLSRSAMMSVLTKFTGLAHRMQTVSTQHKMTWINDSKATNIGACVAALQGFQDKIILIAGGDAKGADMNDLAPTLIEKTKVVILLGKDAPIIATALNHRVPVHFVETLKQAVNLANDLAVQNDTILLSPACASIDQFKNYQQRGQFFINAVNELKP